MKKKERARIKTYLPRLKNKTIAIVKKASGRKNYVLQNLTSM